MYVDAPGIGMKSDELAAAIREHNIRTLNLGQVQFEKPPFARELIGQGGSRAVYAHENPEWVVKVAHSAGQAGANFHELIYCLFLNRMGLGDWIAQCIDYDHGQFTSWLVMERTEPLTEPIELEIPVCLSWDTKLSNWGRRGDRIVCHDYQTLDGCGVLRDILKISTPTTLHHG